jgi:endo-1,4-beta-D-glucanase Y
MRSLAVAALVVLASCSATGTRSLPPTHTATGAALSDAQAFLRTYVGADGRVSRTDQGGDTVSEGQSYGLLLAVAVGDRAEASRIWRWTRTHLRRADGLLAYHASPQGRVLDRSSAADADLVTAWALSRLPGDGADATALGRAVLDHETVRVGSHLLLAAGDWATGSPASLNPSYWALPAFRALGATVPDHRWSELSAGAAWATGVLTSGGSDLPPDWARADGTRLSPSAAPGGGVPDVRYSYDAQRCLIWMSGTGWDARWAARVDAHGTAAALHPDGSPLDDSASALAAVATAAADLAAHRGEEAMHLLAGADSLVRAHPTYYGSAWVALGRLLLTTDVLR